MKLSLESLAEVIISSIGIWGANGDYPIIITDVEEKICGYIRDLENIKERKIVRYQIIDLINLGMERGLISKDSNKDLIYFPYSKYYYKLRLMELGRLLQLKDHDLLNLSDRFNCLKLLNKLSWDDECYDEEYFADWCGGWCNDLVLDE